MPTSKVMANLCDIHTAESLWSNQKDCSKTEFQGTLDYKKTKFQNNRLVFMLLMLKTNPEQEVPWVPLSMENT